MKILAMSNVEGCAERMVEVFENTDANIVAKEEEGDLETLARSVSETMGRNVYDYAVVAVDDYIGATVALNKHENLRAAVCDIKEDFRLAKSSNVNVIIVKTSQKKYDFLVHLIRNGERVARKPRPEKAAEPKQQEMRPQKAEPMEEEEEPEDRGSGKGIMGRLKDSLGIVDDK